MMIKSAQWAGLFGWHKWRLNLADQSGDSFWRTKMGTLSGGPKWQAFWAGQFGDSGGRVILASLFSGFVKGKTRVLIQEKQSNRKESKHAFVTSVDL